MLDGTTSIVEGNQIEYAAADWRQIDAALKKLATRRRELDLEEAEWLVKAERAKVHVHRGCGSFLEYLEQVLGYAPRTAIDRMRVAHALDEFPALRDAELSFSALRELARVVTKETVERWVAQCKGKSLREIEARVSGHKRGDDPDGPRGPQRQVLRLELEPETLALLREVQRDLAGELGHDIDDNTLINQVCRRFRKGGTSKKPAYQIALTTCSSCQRTYQDGGGITVEVSPAVRDQAECDAVHVGRLDEPTPPTVDIPAATRAQVWRRDHGRCTVPDCRAKRCLDIHHLKHRKHGGTHDLENLILICSGHHAAHHAGTLAISGTGSHPRFTRLGDPTPPPAKTTADDVRVMLTSLGFSPREAKLATETAAAHVGAHPSVDALLRAALSTLHPHAQGLGSGKGN